MDYTDWKSRNPDLPEPQVSADGTEVAIFANGVELAFSFSSRAEASAFVDHYANAYMVLGSSWTKRRP